jgi:hypothetical protein
MERLLELARLTVILDTIEKMDRSQLADHEVERLDRAALLLVEIEESMMNAKKAR